MIIHENNIQSGEKLNGNFLLLVFYTNWYRKCPVTRNIAGLRWKASPEAPQLDANTPAQGGPSSAWYTSNIVI